MNAVMFVPNSDSRNTAGPSERPARKYSSTASGLAIRAQGKDADVEDDREVGENEDRRNQCASRSSRCDGHAKRVSAHMSTATARQYAAW